MAVGIPAIDQQHRELVDLLNGLLAALDDDGFEARRHKAMRFRDLALRHLDDEETSFPDGYDSERHLEGHDKARGLINQLCEAAWGADVDAEAIRRLLPAVVMELFKSDAGLARSLKG